MRDNLKRFLIFFLYTIFMLALYYIGQRIVFHYNIHLSSTFEVKPVLIARTIIPIVIGFFLALPKFIYEFRKEGRWKYDWVKLLAIGIPTSYIVLIPIISFYQVPVISSTEHLLGKIPVIIHVMHYSIVGYVLGYILVSSFYKSSNNSDEKLKII